MTELKEILNLDHLEALARAVGELPCTLQPFVANPWQVVIHAEPATQAEMQSIANFYDEFNPKQALALIALARSAAAQGD
jgi:hypothetical protein